MANEIAKNIDVFSAMEERENQTTQVQNEFDGSLPVQNGFIPVLAVAYGTSAAVSEKRIAFPGDFVLGNQTNLGNSIEITSLDYRLKASVYNKTKNEFVSDCYLLRNHTEADRVKWNTYINQKLAAGCQLSSGKEFFVFIPKVNSFATFYMKSTLNKFQAQFGMLTDKLQVASVETVFQKGKKNNQWYDLAITSTGKTLTKADIPADLANKFYALFLDPQPGSGAEDAGEEVIEVNR